MAGRFKSKAVTDTQPITATREGSCPKCGLEHGQAELDCPTVTAEPAREGKDKLIGTTLAQHYEIVCRLGEGGMSVVYKARHTLLDRLVAIKVLREHLISRDTNLARFQQEARAACRLIHPNIITIFEFDLTPDKQPYLVMDYLEGQSLGDLLRNEIRLSPATAVHIFCQTCDALGFAHENHVIHRDIKPSNIMLVKEGEDAFHVKLVDFGIAKLMPGSGLEGQRLTQTGEVFGSPVYMSPEQCTGALQDARSDIYSMGCVMYEALCGQPPFVGSNPLETMYLRLSATPRPFAAGLGIARPLEQIVLICLARDPDKRYQSMAELKGELERLSQGSDRISMFLENLKRACRLKQARATKRSLPAIYIALALLILLASGSYFFFKGSELDSGGQITYSAEDWRKHLSAGCQALDAGQYVRAEDELLAAVKEAQKFGLENPKVVSTLQKLAEVYKTEGKDDQAREQQERIAAIKANQLEQEPGQPDTNVSDLADLTLSFCPKVIEKNKWPQYAKLTEKLTHLAMLLIDQQDYDKAEELLKKALLIEKTTLGDDSPNTATTMSTLAALYDTKKGQFDEALPLYEKAVAIRARALGANHPQVADSLNDLADLYRQLGQYQKSEDHYKQALAIYERRNGRDDPFVAGVLTGLADLYRIQGKYKDSESLYKEALDIYLKTKGDKHSTVAMSYANLAGVYLNEGKYAEAEQMYRRAMVLYEKILGPQNLKVATVVNNLGAVFYKERKFKESERMFKRSLSIRQSLLASDHPEVAQSLNNLAESYREQGRYKDAEPLYSQALTIDSKALGPEHPELAVVLSSFGQLDKAEGKYEAAEEYFKRALAIRQAAFGPEHPEVATSLNELANLYMLEGKYTQAEALFQKTLFLREKILRPNHPDLGQTLDDYAWLLLKTNRSKEAFNMKLRSFNIWLKSWSLDYFPFFMSAA